MCVSSILNPDDFMTLNRDFICYLSFLICPNGIFRTVETDENLKLRFSIGIFHSYPCYIPHIDLSLDTVLMEAFLSQSELVEQMPYSPPEFGFITGSSAGFGYSSGFSRY